MMESPAILVTDSLMESQVQNFETSTSIPIGRSTNLYAKIDSETGDLLETWWTGYFLLNASEMDAIVSELFIGNKLARG